MDPTDRFVEAVRNPTPDIHLDVLTALIGASFERDADVDEVVATLDHLAAECEPTFEGILGQFHHHLTGNTADYGDPRNSYLHAVLHRGLGIPITLSVVAIELGRHLVTPHALAAPLGARVALALGQTGLAAEIIGGTVGDSGFDTTASHPDAECLGMVIAALGAGTAALYQEFYSPSAFVQRYLNMLESGRAADALALPGVSLDSSELTDAGLPASASDADAVSPTTAPAAANANSVTAPTGTPLSRAADSLPPTATM